MHAAVSHKMREGEGGMAVTPDSKGNRSEEGKKKPIWGLCSPAWPRGLTACLVAIGETSPQEGRSFWQEHCVAPRPGRPLEARALAGYLRAGGQAPQCGHQKPAGGGLPPASIPEQGIHPDGFTGDISPMEEILTCARNVATHQKYCQLLLEITREALEKAWDYTGAEQRNGQVSPGSENRTRFRHGLWIVWGYQMNRVWREVHGWEN